MKGLVVDHDHAAHVRQSFERQVGLFSGDDSPFAKRSGELAWIEPLHEDMVVLDVACGAGHAAESVAPRVREVVGIDLTRALLDLGAQRLAENGVRNVLLQEGDAEDLQFVNGSFDLVFCRGSIHHFADPSRASDEMARVCCPGGRLVLVVLVPPDADVRDAFDQVHRLLDPSHVRSYLAEELAELLPGGKGGLIYASALSLRLPVSVAMTEQSDAEAVERLLRDELDGGARTGMLPLLEDAALTVDFTTCILHASHP